MGGVQYSTLFLAEQLLKKNSDDVMVYLPSVGSFSTLCQKYAIPITIYNSVTYISTSFSLFNDQCRIPNPISWIWNSVAIMMNMRRIKNKLDLDTDLIITKGLLNHFTSGIACRIFNIPIICHLQDLITDRYFGLARYLFNYFAIKIPNHVICDGHVIKESLSKQLQNRSTVVLNGIKTNTLIRNKKAGIIIRNEFNISNNAFVIGHLARITPWKGQDVLIKAFAKYSKQNTDAHLLLVGSPLFDNDRYLKYLIKMIDNYKLNDRVIMPGYRTDLKNIYSAMDLFIYPSLGKDTSPLALISAIASGLPVAVSNIDSLREITLLCPGVDTFNLYSRDEKISIMKKYENIKFRLSIGIQNKRSGKDHFDISTHAKNMVQIFIKQISNSK